MKILFSVVLSYLIGSFSSAYFIGKMAKGIDIRGHGSGNSGTTNAIRVMGKKLGILTFIFDFGKGILAVYLGKFIAGDLGMLLGGIAAVVGHDWPLFIGLKGGKGVATSIGVLLIIHWPSTILALIVWLLATSITKYVSLGSISFFVSVPLIYLGIARNFDRDIFFMALALGLLGIYRHKGNIKRLLDGNENKIGR